jgi:hypothetical protein
MVPVPHDPVTQPHQESLATRVVSLLGCVLSTINFDDQAALKANEVDDKVAERMLAAKLEPRELSIAQVMP